MIAVFGKDISSWKDMPGEGKVQSYRERFVYRLCDREHHYEDDNYIVLIDTDFDQSRASEVSSHVERFIEAFETGTEDLSLFFGTYQIVLFDKHREQLALWRDPSGIRTAYYAVSDSEIVVGNLVHDIARLSGVSSFDEQALYQMLYTFYPVDGYTWYEGIKELTIGRRLSFDSELKIVEDRQHSIALARQDNDNSMTENIELLRSEITATLHRHASLENVVLLSGGIDSVVMLAALDELKHKVSVRAVSYRVKGTDQDETSYAQDMADHLGTELSIKEIDPADERIFQRFEQTVLGMNNPYYGVWIFGEFPDAGQQKTFFAGQDSRLHTPAMNILDKISFAVFSARRNPVLDVILGFCSLLTKPIQWLNLSHARPKLLKGIGRLFETLDPEEFIYRYVFMLDKRILAMDGLSLKHFETVKEHFKIDINQIQNQRQLYNVITSQRLHHQFVYNIRYLCDIAVLKNTYLALPFYDAEFSVVCSGLPLKQVTRNLIGRSKFSGRKAIISKYMLRMAFRDKLTDKAFYRKKAVSMTLHLLFEGEMGRKIRQLLKEDIASDKSFLRKYNLVDYVAIFVHDDNWQKKSFRHMYNIYYLAAYCVYNRSVLRQTSHQSAQVSQEA